MSGIPIARPCCTNRRRGCPFAGLLRMPETNPLKRLLTALCYRLGATLAAGAIAIPLEPIPGIDLAYDIGVTR